MLKQTGIFGKRHDRQALSVGQDDRLCAHLSSHWGSAWETFQHPKQPSIHPSIRLWFPCEDSRDGVTQGFLVVWWKKNIKQAGACLCVQGNEMGSNTFCLCSRCWMKWHGVCVMFAFCPLEHWGLLRFCVPLFFQEKEWVWVIGSSLPVISGVAGVNALAGLKPSFQR